MSYHRYMGARRGRIKLLREKHRENVEMATFDVLEEWRNKHDNSRSRQELYQILMQAVSNGLIDGQIIQFLRENPK